MRSTAGDISSNNKILCQQLIDKLSFFIDVFLARREAEMSDSHILNVPIKYRKYKALCLQVILRTPSEVVWWWKAMGRKIVQDKNKK